MRVLFSFVGLAIALLIAGSQVADGGGLEFSVSGSEKQIPMIAAAATSTDGTYTGTITCDPMPPTTGALRTKFSMTLKDGRVSYEREIRQPGVGSTGIFERGTGTVNDAGDIVVTGSAKEGSLVEAQYKGRITGDRVRLEGTQHWRFSQGRDVSARPCHIELAR